MVLGQAQCCSFRLSFLPVHEPEDVICNKEFPLIIAVEHEIEDVGKL